MQLRGVACKGVSPNLVPAWASHLVNQLSFGVAVPPTFSGLRICFHLKQELRRLPQEVLSWEREREWEKEEEEEEESMHVLVRILDCSIPFVYLKKNIYMSKKKENYIYIYIVPPWTEKWKHFAKLARKKYHMCAHRRTWSTHFNDKSIALDCLKSMSITMSIPYCDNVIACKHIHLLVSSDHWNLSTQIHRWTKPVQPIKNIKKKALSWCRGENC